MKAKNFIFLKAVLVLVITSLIVIKSANALQGQFLYCPTFEELQTVFTSALEKNFEKVSVEIVECPDLTKAPFKLATKGLDGDPTLLEVGIEDSDISRKLAKVYDLKEIVYFAGHEKPTKVLIFGAAEGPWPYNEKRSIMAVNVVLGKKKDSSRVTILDEKMKKYTLKTLPANETRFSHKANLFVSEGKTGKVLKVEVKKRTGSDSFVETMQKALASFYGAKDYVVGLGGVFLVNKGQVRQNLVPPFLELPSNSEKQFYSFNMSTPLIALGTILSAKTEFNFTEHRFHTFSLKGGQGGHYQNDVTPDEVEYLGYFNTVGQIISPYP